MFLFIGVRQLVLIKQVAKLPNYFDTGTARTLKECPVRFEYTTSEFPEQFREFSLSFAS